MDLDHIRQDIDSLDQHIVALLEKRMDLVSKVASYKKETGKAIFDAEREEALLSKVAELVQNPDYKETIVALFSDIMKHSRDYQSSKIEK